MLEIRDGYFWDPQTEEYFVPRGIAYQSWNPPVGSNQSLEQVDYDLREIAKMYANSVRAEMVWNEVQIGPEEFDWRKPDFLVETAAKYNLKLFVVIGFQYLPEWAPEAWHAVSSEGDRSVVLSYENPEAQSAYSNYVAKVTRRYKDHPAIGAWILGNEYAYFDLWDEDRRYLGYDADSLAAFRAYLKQRYDEDIGALNSVWESEFESFDAVVMPREYPADRHRPGFHDLIQWREESVGRFVALGSVAAKRHDPSHLRTFSMVGGIFGEADVHYTAEDAKKIVAACEEAGAPLHFWSINNYAVASLATELRSGDYGIGRHQADSGLPVMISETGHTSTENLHPGAAVRQPEAVPGQIWEALMSGAIGAHIFTWNDRNFFTEDFFPREKGFGIVTEARLPKEPVYSNCLELFRRMEQVDIDDLLGGSTRPPPDVYFFWSGASDMGWPRGNHEASRLWSTLKRLGYQPGVIGDKQFERGLWREADALLLSRCYQLDPEHLDTLANEVVPAGVHVHANADLPGRFNAYHQHNPGWRQAMRTLFGLDVTFAVPAWDGGAINPSDMYRPIHFRGLNSLGPLDASYSDSGGAWKIWHRVKAASGSTIVQHTGVDGSSAPIPALQVNDLGSAKTAVNTFALGDLIDGPGGSEPPHAWKLRYDWLKAIYRHHFGMEPAMELTGPGAEFVYPDYRVLRNGSLLLSFLNGHTRTTSLTLKASDLIAGRSVEDLTNGGMVELDSDGALSLELDGDEYVLLYAYPSANGIDESLINPSPEKIWFSDCPTAVWPRGEDYQVTIGHDTRRMDATLHVAFESVQPKRKVYGRADAIEVTGTGRISVNIPIRDADLSDPSYRASPDGGEYRFHAWIEREGESRSHTFLPVRLLWPVVPTALPEEVVPGNRYAIPVTWQELPSFSEPGMVLDRADLWSSADALAERCQIVLELRDRSETVVASAATLTSIASSSELFSIDVPADSAGPFHWLAMVRAAPEVASLDVFESFEGRERGAVWPDHAGRNFMAPWVSFTFAVPGQDGVGLWQNEGVQLEGSHGSQSAFLVATNVPNQVVSGFGIRFVFPEGDWALPEDRSEWRDYRFAFDFREEQTYDALIELQIKNDDPEVTGKWIEYSKRYVPGPDKWDTVEASLDEFNSPPNLFGVFEPDKVHEIVVGLRMLTPSVQYVGSIDNIRFDGPDTIQRLGERMGVYSSKNDALRVTLSDFDPSSGTVKLSWPSYGMLQSAPEVIGPWRDRSEAENPLLIQSDEGRMFFRLRSRH